MDSIASFHWATEGYYITMLLRIGYYPHHMTLCPPVSMVKDAMESFYTILCHQEPITLMVLPQLQSCCYYLLTTSFVHSTHEYTSSFSIPSTPSHLTTHTPHISPLHTPSHLSLYTPHISPCTPPHISPTTHLSHISPYTPPHISLPTCPHTQ